MFICSLSRFDGDDDRPQRIKGATNHLDRKMEDRKMEDRKMEEAVVLAANAPSSVILAHSRHRGPWFEALGANGPRFHSNLGGGR